MVQFMARLKGDACVTKDYTLEEWKEFRNNNSELLPFVIIGGQNIPGEFERIFDIVNEVPEIRMISISFGQGKFEDFQKLLENLRTVFPRKQLISSSYLETTKVQDRRAYARASKQKPPVVRIAIPSDENAELDFTEGTLFLD